MKIITPKANTIAIIDTDDFYVNFVVDHGLENGQHLATFENTPENIQLLKHIFGGGKVQLIK